ncbi:ABC transporter substrate-binding protein [Pseudarthrobacter sp. NPDC092439]|uniref:ABC transporter substrate-binding protein n=1 Tax=unclassified Pseudarthrobacter TaxID=2647000 RepID=UPI00380E2A4C
MKQKRMWFTCIAAVGAAAISLTGCGNAGSSSDAKADGGRGPITFASGKDFTQEMQNRIDIWNDKHPDEKVTMLQLSASPDDQRTSFVQNFQAKSDKYDVLWSDVVWTSEFASRGWIEKLDKERFGGDRLLPSAVDTAMYNGKLYGAPFMTNAGLLYYRSDLVPKAPVTWQELRAACEIAKQHKMDCYAGQFSQYEGLTVNTVEALNSAGGAVLSEDGKSATVNTPEAKEGLKFLVDMVKDGNISKEALTYKEEESRRAFVEGRLMFLNNWPYVYSSASADGSAIKGKFGMATLPGKDGPGVASLGGIDLAVSAFSKHKETAKDWIEFMQSDETQRSVVKDMNQASVVAALYDDPELVKASPYLPTLKESLVGANPRPKTAKYNAVSLAIQKNAYKALQGDVSVDEALQAMQQELTEAIK